MGTAERTVATDSVAEPPVAAVTEGVPAGSNGPTDPLNLSALGLKAFEMDAVQAMAQPQEVPTQLSSAGVAAGGDLRPGDESDERQELLSTLRMFPPWLVSCLAHAMIFLLLALLPLLVNMESPVLELELSASEYDDFQDEVVIEPELFEVDSVAEEIEEEIFDPILLEVELPEIAPDQIVEIAVLEADVSELKPVVIGQLLDGREPGQRQALVKAYGGTAETEAAVAEGLAWLRRKQKDNGSWSLLGRYSGAGEVENRTAATAMALLAFQGAGFTHQGEAGPERTAVVRGWRYLKKQRRSDGGFIDNAPYNHQMYTHCQVTIALCELYAMTQDPAYRDMAQAAVDYLARKQARFGGWRYRPGLDSDTSVTGWAVMALQSARMGGLEVPSDTLKRVEEYLDLVQTHGGARYHYRPGEHVNPALSAEGLLMRQYLQWGQDDPRLKAGVDYLLANPIDYQRTNTYYWYYATQVLHHMEGTAWKEWNKTMVREVPAHQVGRGAERGSWDPYDDTWSGAGGRLVTTCMSIYMLEVYYRHLPLYSHVPKH